MSSFFGYDTFKQRILDHIIYECEQAGIDTFQGVEETMEVVSHLASSAFRRDEALKRLYEQAKEDARRELVAKLSK